MPNFRQVAATGTSEHLFLGLDAVLDRFFESKSPVLRVGGPFPASRSGRTDPVLRLSATRTIPTRLPTGALGKRLRLFALLALVPLVAFSTMSTPTFAQEGTFETTF